MLTYNVKVLYVRVYRLGRHKKLHPPTHLADEPFSGYLYKLKYSTTPTDKIIKILCSLMTYQYPPRES